MNHKSRMGVIVIDCKTGDLEQAASFWSSALGFAADIDPDFPDYIALKTPAGHVKVLLQAVDHAPRLHMDIETNDRQAERERLLKLGATVVSEVDQDAKHWTIMESPTGHRFCLVKPWDDAFDDAANDWSQD